MKIVESTITYHEPGNYYGQLASGVGEDGKFYWSVENHDGYEWSEIPSYVYFALMKFEGDSK